MKLIRYRRKLTRTRNGSIFGISSTVIMLLAIIVPVNSFLTSTETVVIYASEKTTPTQTPTTQPEPSPRAGAEAKADVVENNEVKEIVKEVFGEHADKAFKLLECENRSLNPKAVNQNYDSGKTKDYGLFQINSFWQGIRHEGKAEQFLFDPMINTQIAYRLFVDSGYNFSMWSCGKKMGI